MHTPSGSSMQILFCVASIYNSTTGKGKWGVVHKTPRLRGHALCMTFRKLVLQTHETICCGMISAKGIKNMNKIDSMSHGNPNFSTGAL
jgi:hypothetical protein